MKSCPKLFFGLYHMPPIRAQVCLGEQEVQTGNGTVKSADGPDPNSDSPPKFSGTHPFHGLLIWTSDGASGSFVFWKPVATHILKYSFNHRFRSLHVEYKVSESIGTFS